VIHSDSGESGSSRKISRSDNGWG